MRIKVSNIIDRGRLTTKIIMHGNVIETHIALMLLTIRQELE
jgi:hypothetical protein